MVEVLTILGKHRDHLVVVGGWVPPLIFGEGEHIGSIDVDLAVDWRQLPSHVYETIKNDLVTRGYFQDEDDPPNRFRRDVTRGERIISVKVDLITGDEDDQQGSSHRFVQGIPVWCARGVHVAFETCTQVRVSGTLPDGGDDSVSVRVAKAGALVVMKGMALNERMKEKDAYDIYHCLREHPNGVEGVAAELRSIAGEAVVAEALGHIREKFATMDSVGPVWAGQVIEACGGDYEMARRDAFERAQTLLRILRVSR